MNLLTKRLSHLLILASSSPSVNEGSRKLCLFVTKYILNFARRVFDIEYFVIKGSILTDRWRLGLSDIDIILVSKNKKSFKLYKNVLQAAFPLIRDIDSFSPEEFDDALKSSYRYMGEREDWIILSKHEVKLVEYEYNPYKYLIDNLELVFFCQLWFYKKAQKHLVENSLKEEYDLHRMKTKWKEALGFFRDRYSIKSSVTIQNQMNTLAINLHAELVKIYPALKFSPSSKEVFYESDYISFGLEELIEKDKLIIPMNEELSVLYFELGIIESWKKRELAINFPDPDLSRLVKLEQGI